jgi:hypothetical protein
LYEPPDILAKPQFANTSTPPTRRTNMAIALILAFWVTLAFLCSWNDMKALAGSRIPATSSGKVRAGSQSGIPCRQTGTWGLV